MKNVIEVIEAETGVLFTPAMLKSQKVKCVQLRNIAAELMFNGHNYTRIAKVLEKDRSSVYHMRESVETEMGTNRDFRDLFFKLDRLVHNDNAK